VFSKGCEFLTGEKLDEENRRQRNRGVKQKMRSVSAFYLLFKASRLEGVNMQTFFGRYRQCCQWDAGFVKL
jgi:hypothetical protein